MWWFQASIDKKVLVCYLSKNGEFGGGLLKTRSAWLRIGGQQYASFAVDFAVGAKHHASFAVDFVGKTVTEQIRPIWLTWL